MARDSISAAGPTTNIFSGVGQPALRENAEKAGLPVKTLPIQAPTIEAGCRISQMGGSNTKPCIGLIVPGLEFGGGISSVARFLMDLALASGFDLRLISTATSARDSCSFGISRPASWLRGVSTRCGQWRGKPFVHVGAWIGELEFQRYKPRTALTAAVADCDLLQVVCGSPALSQAVCGLGKPVSVQCATRAKIERRRRDAVPVGFAGWWRKAMTVVTDKIDDRAMRTVDAVQVMNPWMYEYVRRVNEGREINVRCAPPGIDARVFRPICGRRLSHDRYVLCVGRLDDPRKNISLLLEAYALIPDDVRNRLRMLLAGFEPPPDIFWRRASALGLRDRIDFIHRPSRDELVALYQQASVFALPSDEEGFGIVILEAMACGIPVVSTRSGGPEGIITDGEDGYLVPRDDAAALADRIASLDRDEEFNRSMGQRARTTIEQWYTKEIAGLAFLDVWNILLQPSPHVH